MTTVKVHDYVIITAYETIVEILPVMDVSSDKKYISALDWNIRTEDLWHVGMKEFRRLSIMANTSEHRKMLEYLDMRGQGNIWEIRCEVVKPQ